MGNPRCVSVLQNCRGLLVGCGLQSRGSEMALVWVLGTGLWPLFLNVK